MILARLWHLISISVPGDYETDAARFFDRGHDQPGLSRAGSEQPYRGDRGYRAPSLPSPRPAASFAAGWWGYGPSTAGGRHGSRPCGAHLRGRREVKVREAGFLQPLWTPGSERLTYGWPRTAQKTAAETQGAKQQGRHGSGCPLWLGGAPLARRKPEKSKNSRVLQSLDLFHLKCNTDRNVKSICLPPTYDSCFEPGVICLLTQHLKAGDRRIR